MKIAVVANPTQGTFDVSVDGKCARFDRDNAITLLSCAARGVLNVYGVAAFSDAMEPARKDLADMLARLQVAREGATP